MWPRRRNAPPQTPKTGDTFAGKYRIEGVLGEGGMGVVLAARHTRLDDLVAIKVLRGDVLRSREEVQRFLREGRACSKLKSEHVVRILDLGEAEGVLPYLVMEQLEGRDLSMVLRDYGALSVPNVLTCVLEACEAVAEAHALGIVHRDLKPANLFLARTANGGTKVKVLDFGISKMLEEAANADLSLTATRTLMGSPLYMAPELMRSARAADRRSDIWALGCILYELLTGRTPWEGETIPELCVRVIEETPRPIASFRGDVPAGLEAVVARCLAKRPEDRYQDVLEVATALASFAGKNGQDRLNAIEQVVRAAEERVRDRTSLPGELRLDDDGRPSGGTLRGFGTTWHAAQGRSKVVALVAAVASLGLVSALAWAMFVPSSPSAGAAAHSAEPTPLPSLPSVAQVTPSAPAPAPSTSNKPPPTAKWKPMPMPSGHLPKSSPYFDDPN